MDFVPALRGHLGDWEYYITIMKLNDVANRIELAENLHPHKELDKILQRELSDRVKDMTNYLLKQKERFYGSLIVAVYGGNPKFENVRMAEHPLLDNPDSPFGLIVFDGTQQYFALDGQHRLASIRDAVKANRDLGKEEISVIFVPHHGTDEGLRRTRRLFTTVNRYAKPTATHINLALDEDDAVAIVTRRIMREHPLFKENGYVKVKGKNVGVKESDTLTTMAVLYEMNQNFLMTKERNVKEKSFRQFRPEPEVLDKLYDETVKVWTAIINEIEVFGNVAKGIVKPGFVRAGGDNENDGHLLFRPVGQIAFSNALNWAMNKDGNTLGDILQKFNKVDWRLGVAPWKGIVWRSGKMITTKETAHLLARLMAYMIGQEEDKPQLLEVYRRELEDDLAKLPAPVK
jgi:DNA sulfur modification protein DndB